MRVRIARKLPKDASTTLTFEYEGELSSADDSPVRDLKLASIDDDTSYLLYAGRWFPVSGYGINRFTSTINITVPAHMMVIGSGKETVTQQSAAEESGRRGVADQDLHLCLGPSRAFRAPSSPGSFQEFKSDEAGVDLHVFFKPMHRSGAAVRRNRSQRIHLLHHPLRSSAFAYTAGGRIAG